MRNDKSPTGSNQVDTDKRSKGKKYFFFGKFFLKKEKCKKWNEDQITFIKKTIINRSSKSKAIVT